MMIGQWKSKKASGIPRTRVMGDEEGTGIRFGNLSGGGEDDQGQIQEGQAFKPYIEGWHAPPLCSGQCSSALHLLLHHCRLPSGCCARFLDKK